MITLKIIVFCLILFKLSNAQNNPFSIVLVKATDCTRAQYYDISRLGCLPCPLNSVTTSSDRKLFFKNHQARF